MYAICIQTAYELKQSQTCWQKKEGKQTFVITFNYIQQQKRINNILYIIVYKNINVFVVDTTNIIVEPY